MLQMSKSNLHNILFLIFINKKNKTYKKVIQFLSQIFLSLIARLPFRDT